MANTTLSYAKGLVTCDVDRDQALAFLGHSQQVVDDDLLRRLEAMAARCESEHTPRYVWRTFEIDSQAEGVALKGSSFVLPGASIRAHLEGASHVVLLATTIGVAWKQTLSQLNATSPTDALLYDACANALAESAAEAVHGLVASAATEAGLVAHARFSPGYGDLPLDVQPPFLRELDALRKIGVVATENNFLEPAKSITAVIGLFSPDHDSDKDRRGVHLCNECAARDYCNFREHGTTCH